MTVEILEVREYGIEKLCRKLRQVPLMGSEILPYADADIKLRSRTTAGLSPCQYYALNPNFKWIVGLSTLLAQSYEIDILNLPGYIQMIVRTAEGDIEKIDMLPPIVEREMADGRERLIICDGLHRLYYNHKIRKSFANIVVISGIPPEYPYYAHPNKNGWDDVEFLDALPAGYIKKDYRVEPPKHKALFRDFNAAFHNVQKERPIPDAVIHK
jgi:hypothetical protein